LSAEDSLRSLFGALKVSLKNASFYHKEHPAFIKSVEDLKEKIDSLLDIIAPIKIGFTPNAVFFDNKYWEEDRAFRELDRICLLYTSPSPRDRTRSRMPSSA